jgi:hypothetical protein
MVLHTFYKHVLKNEGVRRKSKTSFFTASVLQHVCTEEGRRERRERRRGGKGREEGKEERMERREGASITLQLAELWNKFTFKADNEDLCAAKIFTFCRTLCSTSEGIADKFGNNLIFVNFMHSLHPEKDRFQSELIFSILKKSNARVREVYLKKLPMAFTPENSLEWILRISFLGKLMDLESLQLSRNRQENPDERTSTQNLSEFSQIPSRLIPTPMNFGVLQAGMSHKSKLVVFTMARILMKILLNLQKWFSLEEVWRAGWMGRGRWKGS